jgi:uncharacterized protein
MFVTMVVAALVVDGLFGLLGLIPTGPRPSRGDIFGSVEVNYKLFLNIAGLAVFAALFALSTRGPGHEHGHEPAEALHAG